MGSRDSTVGIATGYGLDSRGVGVRVPSRPALGPTQFPIQWVSGNISLAVKRLARKADQSYPTSAEVENGVALTLRLHVVVLN
jgi:hypothetical protein